MNTRSAVRGQGVCPWERKRADTVDWGKEDLERSTGLRARRFAKGKSNERNWAKGGNGSKGGRKGAAMKHPTLEDGRKSQRLRATMAKGRDS